MVLHTLFLYDTNIAFRLIIEKLIVIIIDIIFLNI